MNTLPPDDTHTDALHPDLAGLGVEIFVAKVEGGKVQTMSTLFDGTLEGFLQMLRQGQPADDEEMPEEAAMDADLMAEIEGDPEPGRTFQAVLADLEAAYLDGLAHGVSSTNYLRCDTLVYELRHEFAMEGEALLAYVNQAYAEAEKKFKGA